MTSLPFTIDPHTCIKTRSHAIDAIQLAILDLCAAHGRLTTPMLPDTAETVTEALDSARRHVDTAAAADIHTPI